MGTEYTVSKDGRVNAKELGIGTTGLDLSSIVDITSTTKGVLLPRQTTAQRDAIGIPADALVIYNVEDDQLQLRADSTWLSSSPPTAITTHTTTWGGAFSSPVSGGLITLQKYGRFVTAHIAALSATADNNTTIISTTGIPTKYRPSPQTVTAIVLVKDNNSFNIGTVTMSATGSFPGRFVFYDGVPINTFSGSGPTGFESVYLHWLAADNA